MKRYLNYLKYILKHKWYVFIGGQRLKVSLWRLLMHDLSKLLPDEFIPYANYFYNEDGTERPLDKEPLGYKIAWWKHIRRNDHHWQHWMLIEDNMKTYTFAMPEMAVREMLADWYGAGMILEGRNTVAEWYQNNNFRHILNLGTRSIIETLLSEINTL